MGNCNRMQSNNIINNQKNTIEKYKKAHDAAERMQIMLESERHKRKKHDKMFEKYKMASKQRIDQLIQHLQIYNDLPMGKTNN